MKVVIACAASKSPGGRPACKFRSRTKDEVLFVANRTLCQSLPKGVGYVEPDDRCGENHMTWREKLSLYNESGKNPDGLSRAADLYTPKQEPFRDLYRLLADGFGWDSVFILSAGWGLIRADFWTPDYNITFSPPAKKEKPWAWRDPKDRKWLDFNHLQNAGVAEGESIHFFGGNHYLDKFCIFVRAVPGRKVIHHKGELKGRSTPGTDFEYDRYKGPEGNRTWHYRAVKEFLAKQPRAEKGI